MTRCRITRGRQLHARFRVAATWLSLWLVPVAVILFTLGTDSVFSQIAVFFSKMAMVTFGGAYAVLAYVAQQAVEQLWLAEAGRDAGRPRHGGDHARAPDHGAAVRGLHGALTAIRAPLSPLHGRRRSAACSRPGSPSRPCFLWIFVRRAVTSNGSRGDKALNGSPCRPSPPPWSE